MTDEGPDHVLALLGYAMDGLRRELVPRMQARGARGQQPPCVRARSGCSASPPARGCG